MTKGLSSELLRVIRESGFESKREPLLYLAAIINTFLERRGLGRVIIVGGYAVELYTGGAYRTGDVDVVVEGPIKAVKEALEMLEPRRGRVWTFRGLARAFDIVSTSYDKPKAPIPLDVEGVKVYVEPPEETVISCLNACVYWDSHLDCEKAAMVMAAQWGRID